MNGEDLEKRVSDLEAQSKRFVSHLQSEQRVYNQHGDRLTEQGITMKVMSDRINELKEDFKALDKTLRNGNGITIRLDRLEQQQKGNDNRTDRWIAIGAILISLISVLIQIIKPT